MHRRLYRKGLPVHEGTYRGDRTVVAMSEFLASKLELQAVYEHYPNKHEIRRDHWNDDDPGCRIAGHVLVNRVPGNFHITAHAVCVEIKFRAPHAIDATVT